MAVVAAAVQIELENEAESDNVRMNAWEWRAIASLKCRIALISYPQAFVNLVSQFLSDALNSFQEDPPNAGNLRESASKKFLDAVVQLEDTMTDEVEFNILDKLTLSMREHLEKLDAEMDRLKQSL